MRQLPDRADIDRRLGDLARRRAAASDRIAEAMAEIARLETLANDLLDDRLDAASR